MTAVSTLCTGRYCLPRSLATALLCRLRGHWPTWHSGVRTTPFGAHAWIEAEGKPVGEPPDITTYRPMVTVAHPGAQAGAIEADLGADRPASGHKGWITGHVTWLNNLHAQP